MNNEIGSPKDLNYGSVACRHKVFFVNYQKSVLKL